MDFKSIPKIEDIPISSQRVLMRVDFNVPLDGATVVDDTRIRAALPTIKFALEQGARLVLMSHLGRPKGAPMPEYTMEPVAARLRELLDIDEVVLTDSCVGDGARRVVLDLRDGEVAVLENLRFHPGETANDDKFARDLASLGEAYVNDAFGTMHRAHASIVGVARHIQKKAAGFLLEKELNSFGRLLGEVNRPYVAVLGGAKVSDKIEMIESLLKKVDTLIIGGAMANTFAAAAGGKLGNSLVEKDKLPLARDLMMRAESKGVRLLIPKDAVSATDVNATETRQASMKAIPDGEMALDIGPETRAQFKEVLGLAKTIFWNGPMGLYEKDPFAAGTIAVAKAISGSTAFSVVGGGDSVAVVQRAGLEKGFDHVSTGGGASLKLIEGKALPGITALLP